MKRLAYNVYQIVNKLYSTIPLVPSNNLVQNIMQDIQYGLYDACGDPEKNWNKWQERCVELLRSRNIIGSENDYRAFSKLSYHDTNDRDCAVVYINNQFFEDNTHNEALTQYTELNNIRRTNNPSSYKREVLEEELYNNKILEDSEFCCLNKVLYDPIERKDVKRIFIDYDTIKNIDINTLISKIKSKYSDYDIYLDNDNACAHDLDNYEKVASLNKDEYSWDEVCQITNNAGGKSYSLPFGNYSDSIFKLEYIDMDSISGYMTYEEYEEYDLDEDMGVVEYLMGQYDDGEDFPPVILDNDHSIIDGSHRVSMYENLGIKKIKAFVLYEEEREVVNV